MGCRNFVFKLFTKEQRRSLEFSYLINDMFFMFDYCWKDRKSFINICYLHYFPYSFQFILALDEVMTEVISFGICRSYLIIFLFLLNISWRTLLIKNLFWLRYFLCSFSFLCIDLRIPVVTHGFFKRMRKPSFLTIFFDNLIYATKFNGVCRLSFTKQISRLGWLLH